MATWVSQSTIPSETRRTGSRTEYWEPHRAAIRAAVRRYLEVAPDTSEIRLKQGAGEEVTLAVIDALGVKVIKEVARTNAMSFDNAKKDLGIVVTSTLVEVYGADNVFTYRSPDGKNSTKRVDAARWPRLGEVSKFTPHRVVLRPERVIFDTGIVRDFVEGTPRAIDEDLLAEVASSRLVSVADGCVAELTYWMQHGTGKKAAFPRWAAQAPKLGKYLDPQMPIAPGGHERTAMCGLAPFKPGYSLEAAKAYSRAVWSFLVALRTAADLGRPGAYRNHEGQRFTFAVTPPETALAPAAQRWADVAQRMGGMLRDAGKLPDETAFFDSMRASVAAGLGLDSNSSSHLDLAAHALARRAREAAAGVYSPDRGASNDIVDFDLLFYVPMPAIVCTADERFVRFVRDLKHPDGRRVMLAAELAVLLRTGRWPE